MISRFSSRWGTAAGLAFWGVVVWGAALFLRLYRLDVVPANLNPDEADTLQTYLHTIHTHSPTLFEFNWNGAPALNTYLIGWTWELLGRSVLGLRMMSALMTAAACVIFFIVVWRLTRRSLLATGLALLLAANPWFLNFSRSGWENGWNGLAILLIALGLYLLYEEKRPRWAFPLLTAGSALGFYFYHPGKLFAVSVLAILIAGQLRPAYRVNMGWLAVFTVSVGILILPQLQTTLCNLPGLQERFSAALIAETCQASGENAQRAPISRNDGWHRISKVSLLKQEDMPALLWESVHNNLLGFARFSRQDFFNKLNERYIPAAVSPIPLAVVLLYNLGLIVALVRYPYWLLLYLLVLLPVQILSVRTPDAARAVHAVPLIFLFAGLPIHLFLETIKSKWQRRPYQIVYSLVIIGIAVGISYQSAQYWRWIGTDEALAARQPAVSRQEYPLWLDILEGRISATDKGFTVTYWTQHKDALAQSNTK